MVDETFVEIIRRRILTQWGSSLKTRSRPGGGLQERLSLSRRLQVAASELHFTPKFNVS